ncbi:MAG: MBL fold metallo-hydrolase [Gammaproteobacteria bacterium]|nr:MBL fold metallo-hydrolase [Gammaproteobacteria bacterium]
MANRPFTQGVHELGNGLYGYVQPDGTWGWSNAGLVVDRGETLLVDTLMSVPLTRAMLDDFHRLPGAARIDRVLNTHANPDHFFGNVLVADAEIIATATTHDEMRGFDPKRLLAMSRDPKAMGEAGEFLYETMGRKFDFSGVDEVTLPTRTFEQQLTLQVGDKTVQLRDLGPAHTDSDTIAFCVEDRCVFTGDLLFNEGHPIMWAGPVENWIKACEFIEALNPEVVVPGHGPITDVGAVRTLREYFSALRDAARARFDAGMDWREAARDIDYSIGRDWTDPERIVANVYALYCQWGMPPVAGGPFMVFQEMGRYVKELEHNKNGCSHAL